MSRDADDARRAVVYMRAAAYVRVSTDPQAREDKDSLRVQREACRKSAEQHGWQIVGEYSDEGVSGAHTDRPQLERLLADAQAGKFDLLVVHNHDRLARTLAAQSQIGAQLAAAGVQVFSVAAPVEPQPPDRFDPLTSDADLLVSGVAGIASELWLRSHRRRVRFGLLARVRSGKPSGCVPYGYALIYDEEADERVAVVVPAQAQHIRQAARIFLEADSLAPAVHWLNEQCSGRTWTTRGLRVLLQNPFLAGKIRYGRRRIVMDAEGKPHWPTRRPEEWLVFDGRQEAIFEAHEWQELQEAMRRRRVQRGYEHSRPHSFAGLVYCAYCGVKMRRQSTLRRSGKRYYGWLCRSWSERGECRANYLSEPRMLGQFCAVLRRELERYEEEVERLRGEPRSANNEDEDLLATLRGQTSELEGRQERLYLAYETGRIPLELFDKRRAVLDGERDHLLARLAVVAARRTDGEQTTRAMVRLREMLPILEELLAAASSDELRPVLRRLVLRIWIRDGRIEGIDYA